MKSILITGANGLLGQHLLAAGHRKFRLMATDVAPRPFFNGFPVEYRACDLTQSEAVRALVEKTAPEIIIHAAAMTNVDACESDRELAKAINADAPKILAGTSRDVGSKMICLSTDYVFDGHDGPYREDCEPHPISAYGQTKLDGERAVLDLMSDAVVARTMVLFGAGRQLRPNFVTWLIDALQKSQPVRIVNDQWGHPTWAGDLAAMIYALIEADASGIYHTAGPDWMTRLDMALAVAEAFELDASLIAAITSAELNQTASRPLRSGLLTDKLIHDTDYVHQPFETTLGKMKQQIMDMK